jgi:hypothetical protein
VHSDRTLRMNRSAWQFALDAAVPPVWVVSGRSLDEIPDFVADRRAARPVRIRPVPRDQMAMPRQQCGRGDGPVLTEVAGQQPGQRGQHGSIRPGGSRPTDLAAQHGDFMPQHQQLCCLRRIAPGKESEPAEHPNHDQILQPNHHEPIMQ